MNVRGVAFTIKNEELINSLVNQQETGMGYQVCTVSTHDGKTHDNVTILNCSIVMQGREVQFAEKDIKSIKVI